MRTYFRGGERVSFYTKASMKRPWFGTIIALPDGECAIHWDHYPPNMKTPPEPQSFLWNDIHRVGSGWSLLDPIDVLIEAVLE